MIRKSPDNGRKALTILREHYLSKRKLKVISLYTELTCLRRLESESITDYIIRTENISNALKEAGEVISDGLLIPMELKGLPPNFKTFTTVITQKKKTLTFSEFKVCLRSYEETECMCYPTNESNNILQMKITFKKINPRNKPRVSMHSRYDYKSTNYNYNNYQKPQHSREDYKISLLGKTNIICYVCGRRGHKAFDCRNRRQSDFCHNIRTYSKGQTYFFALEYDIVSDRTNLLVNCGATNYVITDKSKFIHFDHLYTVI